MHFLFTLLALALTLSFSFSTTLPEDNILATNPLEKRCDGRGATTTLTVVVLASAAEVGAVVSRVCKFRKGDVSRCERRARRLAGGLLTESSHGG